ncbi:hypothetical protein H1C71_004862 [Ictidomys tridecemlineatus]|nr:hypothetical protein H1C71_004862 [Ictidomys tridecemlineatus]
MYECGKKREMELSCNSKASMAGSFSKEGVKNISSMFKLSGSQSVTLEQKQSQGKGRNQKALWARVASCIPMVFVIYGQARFMTRRPKAVNRAQNSKHLLLMAYCSGTT